MPRKPRFPRYAFRVFTLALIFAAACTEAPVKPTAPALVSAWTQLAPGDKLLIRAVLSDANECPVARVVEAGKTRDVKMNVRGEKSRAFPILTCELALDSRVEKIAVDKRELPVLKKDLTKVLVLGDTGCRLKKDKQGFANQGCLDPQKWPFAELARSAAETHPDLVIHVGDYHYREADCPAGDASCQGIVSGDNWESWRQDFFAPAEPLLGTAPWVIARGNHEDCERAGQGWALTLSSQDFSAHCSRGEAPFTFDLGDHRLAIVDNAYEENTVPSLEKVAPNPTKKQWLVLHRPILTRSADVEAAKTPVPKTGSTLVLAGHVHTVSLDRFKDERPPEFIVGTGGANLDAENKLGFLESSLLLKKSVYRDFGFMTLERKPGASEWLGVVRNRKGQPVLKCKIVESLGARTRVDCN